MSKSNTVTNTKLMILTKIRVICICSSSPRAASVNEPYAGHPSQCQLAVDGFAVGVGVAGSYSDVTTDIGNPEITTVEDGA
jgi:hypothetical protein